MPTGESSPDFPRRLDIRLIRTGYYYFTPSSPAYGNKTLAAEYGGYAPGKPGSAQLSVSGHRAIKRIAQHAGLLNLLMDTNCTLERAFRCISEAMDADITRVVVVDGQAVRINLGPNHPIRLQASEMTREAHRELAKTLQLEVQDAESTITDCDNPFQAIDEGTPTVEDKQAAPAVDSAANSVEEVVNGMNAAEYNKTLTLANVLNEFCDLSQYVAGKQPAEPSEGTEDETKT